MSGQPDGFIRRKKMTTLQIILGAVLLAMSVFLIVAVLMQSGKDKGISGTIAGGAETFFGKSKGKTIDRTLSILTAVVAIVFVLVVLAVYVMQPSEDKAGTTPTKEFVTETAAEAANEAAEDAAEAASEAAEAASDAVSEGAEAVSELADEAAEAVSEAVEDVSEAASEAVEAASEAVETATASAAE